MEKWPLGVACVEFVVETLDAWEHIVSDDIIVSFDKIERLMSAFDFYQMLT